MKLVLGVDVGGSTTKIVLCKSERNLIDKLQVEATDQATSLYGAIGNILAKNSLELNRIERIVLTGVGASIIQDNIYDIPTYKVNEFKAIGLGGTLLASVKSGLVISMGTGTAFVKVDDGEVAHIGGSGIGGGTLLGLSSKLLGVRNVDVLSALADQGDLKNVDLSIYDISETIIPSLPPTATAANFGKIKNTATDSDLAIGLMNMIYQTVGMLAVFASLNNNVEDIVVTGALASLPQAKPLLSAVGALYKLNFIIPDNATFATAIGATTQYFQAEN